MPQIKNYTEYFKEEKDVLVMNCSNCQVSVTFDVGGRSENYLFTNSKDPVNLTRWIPFAAIKASMDFRKMLNRVPAALRLLDENEYKMYYERQAQQYGLNSADDAMDRAEQKRIAAQNHQPLPDAPDPIKLHEVVQDGQHLGEKKIVRPIETVSVDEEINPRIQNLCLQVHTSIPEAQKMTAAQMLSELDTISGLTLVDYEYIQSHGYYKSIKNLARKKIAELAASSDEVDDTVPAPAPKKSIKKKTPATSQP